MNRDSDVRPARHRPAVLYVVGSLIAVLAFALLGEPQASSSATPTSRAGQNVPANVSIAFSSKIQTLDPDIAVDYAGPVVLHLIGGTLYELRDGKKLPGLAASSHVSGDGRIWTFVLRKGLRFSNGMPLTSADVEASWDRARSDKANAYAAIYQSITNIATPNAETVVLTLNRPYPSFPQVTGVPQLAIFPAKLINTKGFFDHPVSAGPYVLSSWGGTGTATLTPNKYYVGAKPIVHEVTLETIPDTNSALAQVETGQLDIAFALPPSLISQARSPAKVVETKMYGSEVMTMRGATAPLNQQKLRVAISDALNRQQMSSVIYGGKLKPLKGYWPPSMPGYDPTISTNQDLPGAKAALKGTACAHGCTLTLKYSSTAFPEQGQEALIIKSNLAQVGINVKLVNMDPATYFNVFATYKFQLLLYPLFDEQNIPDIITGVSLVYDAGQQAAYTGLKLPAIEATVHDIDVTSGAARMKGLLKLNRLFVEQAPFASLTEVSLDWATRIPTSVAYVSSDTFVDIGRSQ